MCGAEHQYVVVLHLEVAISNGRSRTAQHGPNGPLFRRS